MGVRTAILDDTAGLLNQDAGVQKGWAQRAASAPDFPPRDERPMEEIMAEYADQYTMRDDETLEQLLDELRKQNEETLQVITEADLDAQVPVPHDVPWFPQDIETVGAVGRAAPHRGADASCGPRRHHPRIHGPRNDV